MDFTAEDIRLMQGLAQRVHALRPEVIVGDATMGELAYVWGKGHALIGDSWRRRLWFDGADLVAWGWAHLPYKAPRRDGSLAESHRAYLAWQVHPERAELLDEIVEWFDTLAPGVDHYVTPTEADTDAITRLADHGYVVDAAANADDGDWMQVNRRDLVEIEKPVLPEGFRFVDAEEAGPEAVVEAQLAAWPRSTFSLRAYEGVRETWPYRGDLHVLVQAPDGTMAVSTVIWLDEANRSAEFEPVGTHAGYRRQGLGRASLLHGMHLARAAGAVEMVVACLGAPAEPAARGLYYSVGFEPFTRESPHVKRAG
jgi:ribosomal protein S18 acetylase RimI-like enzyme